MNLILALGTSLSAVAIAVGFAVVSDRALSPERLAAPQQPAPILPARIAPDLSVGQLRIPARDVAAANPADMNTDSAAFQTPQDLPSAMTSIADAEAQGLTPAGAHQAALDAGPKLRLAPPAATASGPASPRQDASDYQNHDIAQGPRMSLLDPALLSGGDPLATSLATTGIAPLPAAASEADPGSIPAWRFQTLPLIGVYR